MLEDAVRRGLSPAERRAEGRFTIRPTGRGGLRPGIDLSSNSAVAEAMEEDMPADALR